MLTIAIDRGGTFTDVYAIFDGKVYTEKLLSVSGAYEDANSEGVRRILERIFGHKPEIIDLDSIAWVRLGTTVATNALLERKGAPVTFAVTKGFADLLEIRYQDRPDLFALDIQKPKPLYKKVIEIDERVLPDGDGYKVLYKNIEALRGSGESLAVALLHSYGYEAHEKEVAKLAEGFGHISLSSEVSPSLKIVTRAETTVVDAYLTPVVREYVAKILKNFRGDTKKIYFIKSDGGLCQAEEFRGASAILSGPAGGVVAMKSVYAGVPLIGFDMGGTSTDVSRYDGAVELRYESEVAGCYVSTPMVDIHTVAAGGGSRHFYKDGMFVVGPESAGSDPGPLCYGKDGYLSVTDANLVTGRLDAQSIPAIFGKSGNEPLSIELARQGFAPIAQEVGASIEEVAQAFLDVANEHMANAIKEITIKKGYDPKEHILCAFGGAGGQHAVAVARKLGIKRVFIHRYSGIFSAVGIAYAEVSENHFKVIEKPLEQFDEAWFADLPEGERSLFLRYRGTNTTIEVSTHDPVSEFEAAYKRMFGFLLDTELIVERIKVRTVQKGEMPKRQKIAAGNFPPIKNTQIFLGGRWQEAKVYKELGAGQEIAGPALIVQESSTIVLDEASTARVSDYGDIEIELGAAKEVQNIEAAKVSLLANRMQFVAKKMGEVLQKAAISTNIKERHDFSCAIFDAAGNLVTNAPHIPVHLGSMSSVVRAVMRKFPEPKNATYITNVPYEGGSHLPDITVVTPYIEDGEVRFWVASRGHHADIGGSVPGSMPPFSRWLSEEGAIIEAFAVVEEGRFDEAKLREIFQKAGARRIEDNISDIRAQIAANMEGIRGVLEIADYEWFFERIQAISAAKVRDFFAGLTPKEAEDYLDNGARIHLKVYKEDEKVIFDFRGSNAQLLSNQNAPYAVVRSAVLYAVRVMLGEDVPLNEGLLEPLQILVPKSSLLGPDPELAVVGGNVTTSQRIVDVIFKAFGVSGASQGCMNNVIIGDENFGYYETIAGGAGATAASNGASGVHTHMTNTKITDPEIIERRYPFMIERFALRRGSGGAGRHRGGDGIERIYRFFAPLQVSLLTERRVFAPYGMAGGESGAKGENILEREGKRYDLRSKASLTVQPGDKLIIKTPGGGGYGESQE